jgi:UDP-N-acetylglucosamine enolpyruvyl transferase
MPTPGGDKIGRRRLDTHFQGFVELGAEFHYDEEQYFYSLKAKELHGKFILLEEASVTGTANILMAAVLAKGKTRIYNAACEPYLQQLCKMLNRMGANISGVGSNLLTIEGVEHLHGTEHTMLPDMVEIGSWIGLAAMTKSEITIKNVNWNQLGIIPDTFRKLEYNWKAEKTFTFLHRNTIRYRSLLTVLSYRYRRSMARLHSGFIVYCFSCCLRQRELFWFTRRCLNPVCSLWIS